VEQSWKGFVLKAPLGGSARVAPLVRPAGTSHSLEDHSAQVRFEARCAQILQELTEESKQILSRLDRIESRLAGQLKDPLTVEEVATLAGRSAYSVRRWVRLGRLPATRVSGSGPKGRLLIRRRDLERILEEGLGEELPSLAVCSSGGAS